MDEKCSTFYRQQAQTSTETFLFVSSCLFHGIKIGERKQRERNHRVCACSCAFCIGSFNRVGFFVFICFSPFLQFSMLFKHVFLSQFKFFSHGHRQERRTKKKLLVIVRFLDSIFGFCYRKRYFCSLFAFEKAFVDWKNIVQNFHWILRGFNVDLNLHTEKRESWKTLITHFVVYLSKNKQCFCYRRNFVFVLSREIFICQERFTAWKMLELNQFEGNLDLQNSPSTMISRLVQDCRRSKLFMIVREAEKIFYRPVQPLLLRPRFRISQGLLILFYHLRIEKEIIGNNWWLDIINLITVLVLELGHVFVSSSYTYYFSLDKNKKCTTKLDYVTEQSNKQSRSEIFLSRCARNNLDSSFN